MNWNKINSKNPPTIVGTGLVALDVVFKDDQTKPLGRWAGGTCGNVLSILSWLGWDAYPVARFKAGSEASAIMRDLQKWNVKTDLMTYGETGSTPVILQYINQDANGHVFHRFKMRCPVCGNHLPGFRPITGACVSSMTPKLPDADVFYFDRTSRGILDLAAYYFEAGSTIVFEPSGIGEPSHFEEAIEIAHIVKYSNDRLSAKEVGFTDSYPSLFIETMGSKGLRYRCRFEKFRTNKWQTIPANSISAVQDTAGAGDWCIAGILQMLGSGGDESFKRIRKADLLSSLQLGQSMSAWSCAFEGARGGMYQSNLKAFRKSVKQIVAGAAQAPERSEFAQTKASPFICQACEV